MKKSMLYLLIVVMSVSTVNAQKGGAGFFKTGYLYAPGSSSIVKEVTGEAEANLSNNYLVVGIEAYYRRENVVFCWEGYSGQTAAYSFKSPSTKEPFIISTQVKLGRIIQANKKHWLYPSVGIGSTAIILYQRGEVNDKQATNPASQMLLTPSIDLGINEDVLLAKVNKSDKKYGGLILGLRAGYRTAARSNNWRDNSWNKLYNMPFYSNSCFYLSASIGAGRFFEE